MSKPFWEKTYQNDAVSTFAKGPTADVSEFWRIYPAGASVLDVGCGEGRNSIFLAENGFTVDAFDLSHGGVEKAKRIATSRNVRVNFWQQDLTQYTFEKNYDIILSHGVLHLVTKSDWSSFIVAAKSHTNSDGLNVIGIFTNRLPATPDNAPFTKGLFDVGELPALYADWEMVHHHEGTFKDEHPGGIRHEHAYERIIARKA